MFDETDDGLDSQVRVHLEWMFENQPEFVRELHREGKLRQHLDQKNQQVLRYVAQMKQERGMSDDEAFGIADAMIEAPADGPAMGDNPPEPVPCQEQEAIYRALCPE